jgi:hypothetical protein
VCKIVKYPNFDLIEEKERKRERKRKGNDCRECLECHQKPKLPDEKNPNRFGKVGFLAALAYSRSLILLGPRTLVASSTSSLMH